MFSYISDFILPQFGQNGSKLRRQGIDVDMSQAVVDLVVQVDFSRFERVQIVFLLEFSQRNLQYSIYFSNIQLLTLIDPIIPTP